MYWLGLYYKLQYSGWQVMCWVYSCVCIVVFTHILMQVEAVRGEFDKLEVVTTATLSVVIEVLSKVLF